jgi:hypothetical protein
MMMTATAAAQSRPESLLGAPLREVVPRPARLRLASHTHAMSGRRLEPPSVLVRRVGVVTQMDTQPV